MNSGFRFRNLGAFTWRKIFFLFCFLSLDLFFLNENTQVVYLNLRVLFYSASPIGQHIFVRVQVGFRYLSKRHWHSCTHQMCHKPALSAYSEGVMCHLASEIENSSKEPLEAALRSLGSRWGGVKLCTAICSSTELLAFDKGWIFFPLNGILFRRMSS